MTTPLLERRWFTIVPIILLGVIHSMLSFASASTKSPTFDESIHALGGYSIRFFRDYRIDPEDPALWHRIHALAALRNEATIDQSSVVWNKLPDDSGLEFLMAYQTYFESKSADVDAVINRRRALLSIFGAATVIGSGLLARAIASVIGLPRTAAGLFTSGLLAFDPNLLAHSSIIKNDVITALLLLGMSASLWSIGRRIRWHNAIGLIACMAFAPLIKFSGILFAPIALLVLVIRALMPRSLPVGSRVLTSRLARLGFVTSILVVATALGYIALWSSYGFRFSITSNGVPFSFDELITLSKINLYDDVYRSVPIPEIIDFLPMDRVTQLILLTRDHHIAPEAWLYGFLHVHVFAANRSAYLFGQYADGGFWYYFPSVFLLKTPLASIVLLLSTITISSWKSRKIVARLDRFWPVLSIGLPAFLLLLMSMRSGLNIGIRHILPIWPALFVAVGLFLSWLWNRRLRVLRYIAFFAVFLTAFESVLNAPNYISFLNVIAGRMNQQLNLLSDSNLDWGQDLPALAKWRKANPNVPLYFSYFGTADPNYYGIGYINIKPGHVFVRDEVDPDPNRPGVIAYSASVLTAAYYSHLRDELKQVRLKKPLKVIGGSIYLYKWPFDMPDDQWEAATGLSVDQ